MSLLEDLQVEVKKIRSQKIQHNAELEAQKEFYDVNLRPVMIRVYEYFSEIVESLNIVEPDIEINYPLNPSLKGGVVLKQSQYKFRSDNPESPHQVDIHCRCTLVKPHQFYVSTYKAVQAHVELLDSYNFSFERKNRLDRHHEISGATFFLEGPMFVQIRISASPTDRNIHILLRNIGEQPVKRYKLLPGAVNEEFLERLAKLLIRKVPQLTEVKVDSNFRKILRDQVALDKRQKEEHLSQAYSDRESERKSEKTASFLGRSKRVVVEHGREIVKIFSRR